MSAGYELSYGTHANPQDGRCAMEWVSFLAGEEHSDEPACVSPVLRVFCIALNDRMDDLARQRLRPYLTRTIGTSADGHDEARAWMAMDWLIRDYAPAWLDFADVGESAALLRDAAPVGALTELTDALELLALVRGCPPGARGVIGGARLAPWAGPRAAGRTAAREAAWSAAGAAAWAAARLGVGDMAGDRARAAVRAIAGDCAAATLRAARERGHAAARAAAREQLAPVLGELQDSALGLLDRMLPTVAVAVAEAAPRARSGSRQGVY